MHNMPGHMHERVHGMPCPLYVGLCVSLLCPACPALVWLVLDTHGGTTHTTVTAHT